MGFLDLFVIASIPVLKVLLITALGLFLALDHVDVLGEIARKHLNKVVFFVFNPALVGSNLAKTITFKTFLTLWFMPVNILITFAFGSALGWILVKVTRAPKHLKGLIVGACSAGNLGSLPMIIIPAICKEKGSPFGDADVCQTYGLAYASLSMALGAIFLWLYVYNIVRISSRELVEETVKNGRGNSDESNGETSMNYTEPLFPSTDHSLMAPMSQLALSSPKSPTPLLYRLNQRFREVAEKINLKALLAPSTTGAIVGFAIGMIQPVRKLVIGNAAPLHVIEDSASLLGDAAIPTVTLILGANLLRGLKGSGIQLRIVIGIVAVRYIFLPLLGIIIIRGAIRFGLLQFDPLFQFILLLQYAVPPAMNIERAIKKDEDEFQTYVAYWHLTGTITQLFGAGQSECSVIMLWSYALASVSLTLWSTFFLWLVAS